MRISLVVSTNVPYVRTRSRGLRRSGRARPAGQSSISAASRNGRRTKAQPSLVRHPPTESSRRPGSGGALGATSPKMYSRTPTHAGARKSRTRKPSRVCRHIRADRVAAKHDRSQRHVHILAMSYVTPVRVSHVPTWALLKAASAVEKWLLEGAWRQTTVLGVGVAARFVAT